MNLQLGYTPLTGFTLKAYQPDHLSGFLTIPNLEAGFPLRCFQRLSIPDIATEQCPWQDSSYTRGQFTPVLSSLIPQFLGAQTIPSSNWRAACYPYELSFSLE